MHKYEEPAPHLFCGLRTFSHFLNFFAWQDFFLSSRHGTMGIMLHGISLGGISHCWHPCSTWWVSTPTENLPYLFLELRLDPPPHRLAHHPSTTSSGWAGSPFGPSK